MADNFSSGTISFTSIIGVFNTAVSGMKLKLTHLASSYSSANPGEFLLAQFEMAQITQLGDTISNLISQVNSVISNSVRNQKQ